LPHSWNNFSRSYFSIYIHVYKVFVPYSPSHTFSPILPPSHWYLPHQTEPVLPFCSLILWEQQQNDIFVCLG
jgi:hypothetical protein